MFRGSPSIGAIVALAFALLISPPVRARSRKTDFVEQAVKFHQSNHTYELPAAGTFEVAFSPDEGSEKLVIKVIDSAKSQLCLLSYSFTSVPIVEALVRARHRGVDVKLVADHKDNVGGKDRSGSTEHRKNRAALNALASAGADVRTISKYAIHHDKAIIADRETVQMGSFNYTDAAAHKNSENVLVVWRHPELAAVYLHHFDRNYRQAVAYEPNY